MRKSNKVVGSKSGFTIIELLIVIAIIGILATITIVGYGAWRNSTITAAVKSDLSGAASAMENARTFSNGYPTTLPTTFTASSGISLTMYPGGTSTTYCIDGISTEDSNIKFYIDSETRSQGATKNTCALRTGSSVPSVPTNPTVISASETQVSLSWTLSPTATSYTEQCASDAGFITGLQQASQSGTTGTVSGLTSQTTLYCRVKATNSVGSSNWSAVVNADTAVPDACPTAPNTPGFATATTTSSTVLGLTWAAVACEDSYGIDRSTNPTFPPGFTSVSQSGSGTSYSATGLLPGTTYYFRVKAVNAHGSSGWTANTGATTSPSTPTGLLATTNSTIQITASWNAVSSATSYDLDYSSGNSFDPGTFSTINTASTSQAVAGLTDGTTYYFRVRANIGANSSLNSGTVNATTTSVVLSGQSSCISTYSNKPNYRIEFTYLEVSPNVAANTSNVYWTAYRTPNNQVSGTWDETLPAGWTFNTTINGTTVLSGGQGRSGRWRSRTAYIGDTEAFYGTNTSSNSSYSGTITVAHNADGTKTVSTSAYDGSTGIFGTASCSGSYVLSDLR